MKLKISRNVINCLIRSAIETYPCESSGYLLGRGKITEAAPYQCAKRNINFVTRDDKSTRKVFKTIRFSKNKFLGEFHSHSGETTKLSKADVAIIKNLYSDLKVLGIKMKGWIEIIISIYERRKEQNRFYMNLTRNGTNLHITLPKSESSIWDVNMRVYTIDLKTSHQDVAKLSIV